MPFRGTLPMPYPFNHTSPTMQHWRECPSNLFACRSGTYFTDCGVTGAIVPVYSRDDVTSKLKLDWFLPPRILHSLGRSRLVVQQSVGCAVHLVPQIPGSCFPSLTLL